MSPQQTRAPRSRFQQVWPVVVGITIAGLAAPSWQWYRWATAGDSPYDEIGIDLNGYMPAPIHDWACGRIAQRFPGSIPPYGCEARTPT